MLGYIVSYKPELKVREAEMYKGYYCGVCKSIGKRYGQIPRMILSYDAAFLALVLDCIFDESEKISKEGCIANPFKKKVIVHSKNIDFAGDVMLILAWYKMMDDIEDENRLYAKISRFLFKRKFKRIYKNNRRLCEKIEKNLKSLGEIESKKTDSIDMPSHYFGQIMADIFEEGILNWSSREKKIDLQNKNKLDLLQNSHYVEIFREIGYNVGKWVYLIDALDDIDDNIKTGAYNPLIYRYSYNKNESIGQFKARIKSDVERILIKCLEHVGKALDLLEIRKNKGILNNVLYLGLLNKTDEILGNKSLELDQS